MPRRISFLPPFQASQTSSKKTDELSEFLRYETLPFSPGTTSIHKPGRKVRSRKMTTDEEIQKEIDELEAPIRRRSAQLRFILKMTILGGGLAGLSVLTIVFLGITGISLATGIRFIDSMLYSMGGGPMVIFLAAIIWSIPGAIAGGIVGCVLTNISSK
jgi:hypothetical protein